MRACARCTPPRAPDVALLLLVLLAALVVALEAAGPAAPCSLHRARRTTSSDTSPSSPGPSAPSDGTMPSTAPGLTQADPTSPTGGLPGLDAPSAPATGFLDSLEHHVDPVLVAASPEPSDAMESTRMAPSSPSLPSSPSSSSSPSSPSSPSEPALSTLPTGDSSLELQDSVLPPQPKKPDAVAPTSREADVADARPPPTPVTVTKPTKPVKPPPRAGAGSRSAAAKLLEERARRLQKIQRDMLELKRRRLRAGKPVTDAPPDFDLGDDDSASGADESSEGGGRGQEVADKERKHHRDGGPLGGKSVDGHTGNGVDGHGGKGVDGHGGKVVDGHGGKGVDGHGVKGSKSGKGHGGKGGKQRTQDHDDDLADRPAGKHARRQHHDDRDRSVEDNSVSDGDDSWEQGGGSSGSGEWGGLVCPATDEVSLFSRQCQSDRDCKLVGEQCCKDRIGLRRCVLGVTPTLPDIPHEPFFGVIARVCPSAVDTLVEPWAITNCTTDDDCWPRVCCVDGPYAYCRTPQLEWEKLPGQRFVAPLRLLMSYLQCTPPPPPVFDLFPKPCRNTLDCFPNLCCQERGRKVCRPPKRSLLALLATLGQGADYSLRSQRRLH